MLTERTPIMPYRDANGTLSFSDQPPRKQANTSRQLSEEEWREKKARAHWTKAQKYKASRTPFKPSEWCESWVPTTPVPVLPLALPLSVERPSSLDGVEVYNMWDGKRVIFAAREVYYVGTGKDGRHLVSSVMKPIPTMPGHPVPKWSSLYGDENYIGASP